MDINTNNVHILWDKSLDLIKKEMNDLPFNTWVKPLVPLYIKNDTLYIQTFDNNHVNFLNKYYDLIKNAINIASPITYDLKIVPEGYQEEEVVKVEKSSAESTQEFKSLLNPRYTFSSFVIGANNRFAHAAAVAVTESPARMFNPLFIYGDSGLGKTHLLNAIGNQIIENNPSAKVLYVSSEKFTNELINSLKEGKMSEFRDIYRKNDVLIIDDIHFLSEKTRTQEEFFHTFNDLYEAHKQIIISSDRPPNEMSTLEDRLKTRFAWGLIADISKPDLETKIAILKKKGETENINIPDDVYLFIANNVSSSIRELEGALNRLIAFCTLTHSPISIEIAEQALGDIIAKAKNRKISCELIINSVSRYFDIRIEEIKSKKRNREIAYPRQIAMFLCRDLTDLSLEVIAGEFERDHTTVMHAVEKIKNDLKFNEETQKSIAAIKKHIF